MSSIGITATQNHIHKTVLRQGDIQTWLFLCRYFFPMPQLTPDCDRVVIISLPPTDGMDFIPLSALKLFQMMTEIRISEDYCRSDIYVADYGNFTLRHVTKITPSVVKKFELCGIVSSTHNFCVNNEYRS
jgi:hypothetical protein